MGESMGLGRSALTGGRFMRVLAAVCCPCRVVSVFCCRIAFDCLRLGFLASSDAAFCERYAESREKAVMVSGQVPCVGPGFGSGSLPQPLDIVRHRNIVSSASRHNEPRSSRLVIVVSFRWVGLPEVEAEPCRSLGRYVVDQQVVLFVVDQATFAVYHYAEEPAFLVVVDKRGAETV